MVKVNPLQANISYKNVRSMAVLSYLGQHHELRVGEVVSELILVAIVLPMAQP